ncbi:PAS domain-containing protein [Geomonas sp.]|uniref:PAS domain-containing protein n=1 Tax=Geomonas sp. TaxID=2651584 RepID=UPI002B45F587|nr:PAS domain-containing protein [Geomonas sp.]HJV36076.1 PAS domain-containing protein [Geomonas sp.]
MRARCFAIRLIGVVLLLDLFVVAMAFVSLRESRRQYAERAAVQSQNLCQALVYSMTGIMDVVDVALSDVVDDAEDQLACGGIKAQVLDAAIVKQHRRLPDLDGLRMANARGEIVYGTDLGSGAVKSVADRDYFRQLRDNPKAGLVISKPLVGRICGKWLLIAARRVNNPDGSFAGVVCGSLTLERIQKIMGNIDVGASGGISLRQSDTSIIVRHPNRGPGNEAGRQAISAELLRRAKLQQPTGTFYTPLSWDHTPKILSYQRLERYPLFILVALAARDYLAPWHGDFLRMAALVALFVAMTIILSRLAYRWWLREKIAEEALRKSKAELEQRVAERTAELFTANSRLVGELQERQLTEERLRQSRNTLAQIINAIPQSVFWKDRDSVYLGCNVIFAGRAGYDDTELVVGKTDYDLPWLREESDAYREDDKEVMEGNAAKTHIVEQQLQADGTRVWVDTTKVPLCDDQGEVYGVLGVYEDITLRKAVEESRDKALTLFESLLTSSPTGIQVFDGESGDCVTVNDALLQMIGGERQMVLAQNFRGLRSWKEAGIEELAEQVLSDSITRRMEKKITSTFGKTVHLDFFLTRCDVEGRPHLMMIAQDVSESKRLEEENKKIAAQMLHVQKLESLGVLAGGIAHDFNNILMVVVGNTDLALMHCVEVSPLRENLLQIDQAATRASELARQMLDYSGRGRFLIENLDLTAIVRDMVKMLEVSVSKKALLSYDFAPGLPPISGDATQLRQVLLNLVLNASEALGEQPGSITLRTYSAECDRGYLAGSWIDDGLPAGTYLVLEVADTGCGMDQEVVTRIFDPFFTTKFTGRGLGMAAVLGIVRGHKGAIRVASEEGKGTVFRLLFPAVAVATGLPATDGSAEVSYRGKGTVLLVDDEETIREVGKEMLQMLGFCVLTASDGQKGIDTFQRHAEQIACVLLDLTMPVMDGVQAFNELRRLQPEVRVVITSGYSEQEVSRKFAGEKGVAFIQKPYKLAAVSRKLQELLG